MPFRRSSVFTLSSSNGATAREVSSSTSNSTPGPFPLFFRYPPLVQPESQIRLFKFIHGNDGILSCRLEVYCPETTPPAYTAISYTWGETQPAALVKVNGAYFRVRPNCWLALRQASQSANDELFWIDSLCINQNDHQEKSAQVRRMGDIFGEAIKVFACLSQHGVAELKHRHTFKQRILWIAQSTYFQRIWTAQECILAKRLSMVSRTFEEDLEQMMMRLRINSWSDYVREQHAGHTQALQGLLQLLADRNLSQSTTRLYADGSDLADVVLRYSHRASSNPRDKIYGLLSLVSFAIRKRQVVDYGQSLFITLLEYTTVHYKQVNNQDVPEFVQRARSIHWRAFGKVVVSIKALLTDFMLYDDFQSAYSEFCWTRIAPSPSHDVKISGPAGFNRSALPYCILAETAPKTCYITITRSDLFKIADDNPLKELLRLPISDCISPEISSRLLHLEPGNKRLMLGVNPPARRLEDLIQGLGSPKRRRIRHSLKVLQYTHTCRAHSASTAYFLVPASTRQDDIMLRFFGLSTYIVCRPIPENSQRFKMLGIARCLHMDNDHFVMRCDCCKVTDSQWRIKLRPLDMLVIATLTGIQLDSFGLLALMACNA